MVRLMTVVTYYRSVPCSSRVLVSPSSSVRVLLQWSGWLSSIRRFWIIVLLHESASSALTRCLLGHSRVTRISGCSLVIILTVSAIARLPRSVMSLPEVLIWIVVVYSEDLKIISSFTQTPLITPQIPNTQKPNATITNDAVPREVSSTLNKVSTISKLTPLRKLT